MKTKICPQCGKTYVPDLIQEAPQKVASWLRGEGLIQSIFPTAQAYQREQLQTGLCSDDCFDDYVGFPEN